MKKYLLILTAILLSVVTGCKQTENDKKLSIELSLDQESVTATGAVINVKQENATKGAYFLTNDLQATITIEDVFAKGTELKSSDTKINLNGLKANTDYKVVAAISAEGQQLLSNEVKFKTQELPAEAPVIKFKQLDVTENSALIEVTTEKATKAFILCEPKGMTANADEEYIRKNGDEIPSEMLNKSFEATYEALSSETTYVIYSVAENESIAIVGETFEFTTLEEIPTEDPYIKFAFITGVTTFRKISVFNDLNLMDISMDYRYVNICGTTEEELKSYFKEGISELASANGDSESETIDKLRMRYGGYHFEKNSEGIYNPFSVLNTLAKHRYKNYWFETGTPTFHIGLLKEHGYRLPDLSKEQVSANVMSSMDSSFPNPIPVIYQSGYLTIKGYDERFKKYQLGFPNKEVEEGFLNLLLPLYNSAGDRSSFMVDELEA